MNVEINKDFNKKERDKHLKKVIPRLKKLDAKKFFGKVSWKGDPLKMQQEMRDE